MVGVKINPIHGTCVRISDDAINMQVEVKGVEYPFTATSYDLEQHGRDLYIKASNGEFGEITVDYVE
jgi:hypothetical protein